MPPTTSKSTQQAPVVKNCGNCLCFLLKEESSGKGVCRLDPPLMVPNHEATESDPDYRRRPICFESEWCSHWEPKK